MSSREMIYHLSYHLAPKYGNSGNINFCHWQLSTFLNLFSKLFSPKQIFFHPLSLIFLCRSFFGQTLNGRWLVDIVVVVVVVVVVIVVVVGGWVGWQFDNERHLVGFTRNNSAATKKYQILFLTVVTSQQKMILFNLKYFLGTSIKCCDTRWPFLQLA